MTGTPIEVPEGFALSTVQREGERGRTWLATLPGLADELLRRWDCEPSEAVTHGQVGIVVPVRRRYDGTPAVLKISFPHPGNVHEPDAFAVWAGRGAVRLYERDDARFAMLLERAGAHSEHPEHPEHPEHSLASMEDTDEAVAVAGRLARRLAVPAPAGLPRMSSLVAEWECELRDEDRELGSPLPARVVAAAIATVRELGRDQPETLVHGDLHFTNVLRSEREPWLAIDPKGYVGDPAYDSITLLRTRFEALLTAPDPRAAALRRLDVFADAAEVDRERARRWAQARAVTAAHWGMRHGDPAWLVKATEALAEALT
ncbi:aminoglycoside phosphotransferase family protein [Streptomyces sp. NBC_01283]|uniref:aminoglycoside phosphotransferase family protein n=1 Tax=Streptomyces sp. NBC_01283 TaxID=2903812 RepID=UPI00352BF31D|nr:aminoglycoside phosphotransferase family protein [Streptomyces sp. NBC_01283]